MNHQPDLSVVIPCYNEGQNLPRLMDAVAAVVPADFSLEVIFVDNGSTDDSAQVLRQRLPGYAFARSVTVDVNRGYGYGILQGLRAATGQVVGWTHADLQTDPADVIDAYRRFRDRLVAGHALVKGRRIRRPILDRAFTSGMSVIASVALGGRFSDINAQPKLFHRRLLDRFESAPHDFSLDLFALWIAAKEGYQVLEHPVVFGDRLHGEAKGGGSLRLKWKLTRRTLSFIVALRRRLAEY
jgi:glycosyltransferase involved in cell wall biosynthesis